MARKIQALLAAARPLYARGGEAVGGAIVRLPEVLFFLTGCRIRTVKTLRACLSIWPWRFAQQSGATDAYSKTWLRLRGARLIEICLFEFPFRAAAGRQTAPSPHWSSSLCPPRTRYACNARCPHGHQWNWCRRPCSVPWRLPPRHDRGRCCSTSPRSRTDRPCVSPAPYARHRCRRCSRCRCRCRRRLSRRQC